MVWNFLTLVIRSAEGLSFFLGFVAFGRVANDFIHALTKDLGGSVTTESDLAIGGP